MIDPPVDGPQAAFANRFDKKKLGMLFSTAKYIFDN